MINRKYLLPAACLNVLLLAGCTVPSVSFTGNNDSGAKGAASCSPSSTVDKASNSVSFPEVAFSSVSDANMKDMVDLLSQDTSTPLHAGLDVATKQARTGAASTKTVEGGTCDSPTMVPAAATTMTPKWVVMASSPTLVGLQRVNENSGPDNSTVARETLWFDTVSKKALAPHDLISDSGMDVVKKELSKSFEEHGGGAKLDLALKVLDGGSPAIGFDDKGQLLVGFDADQINSSVAPLIAVPGDAKTLLTKEGLRAQAAATSPKILQPSSTAAVDCKKFKCAALTFDDGPNPTTTPRLLDILKERGVPATFFLVGKNVKANPQIVKREVDEGHEIANHSWSHPELTKISNARVLSEITQTTNAIKAATGVTPTLVRPPYGSHSPRVDAILKSQGLVIVLWTNDTLDWKHRDPKWVTQAAAKTTRDGIILMHDIHPTTVDGVDTSIDALQAQGYVMVTVSQLIGSQPAGTVIGSSMTSLIYGKN